MYQLAIFDLDGTLLDTLADLRQGLNYALSTQGFAPRTLPEVRAFVGNGIRKLIERAVPRRHGRGADRSALRGVQSLLRRPLRGFYNALSRHFGAAAAAAKAARRCAGAGGRTVRRIRSGHHPQPQPRRSDAGGP